jgi:hypothetical protein
MPSTYSSLDAGQFFARVREDLAAKIDASFEVK